MRQAIHIGENDRLAIVITQICKAAPEIAGFAPVLVELAELGVDFGDNRLVKGDLRPGLLAQPVKGGVARHGRQPGQGLAFRRVILPASFPNLYKGFLQHILGNIAGLQHAERDGEELRAR